MSLNVIGGIVIGVIALVILAFIWNAFWLWWQSILSNATVGLFQIIFMRFRKVPPGVIVTVRITAKKAGIDLSADEVDQFAEDLHRCAINDRFVQESKLGDRRILGVRDAET